ncbi:MAG: hypothetical protein SVX38_16905 [Chloroflexota bacterium]|nr:hypothetical protein [Chloroflexota bacterium]
MDFGTVQWWGMYSIQVGWIIKKVISVGWSKLVTQRRRILTPAR